MNIKSKFGLKGMLLLTSIFLSGCRLNNPYTINTPDLNKDSLPDITITDSVGNTAEYLQRKDGKYINSPFIKASKIKDLKDDRNGTSFLYTDYTIKRMDLNKDSLPDIAIIFSNRIEKYLQRKDGKYVLSIEDMPSSNHNNDDNGLPILLNPIFTPYLFPTSP